MTTSNNEPATITPLTKADLEPISQLARDIWYLHYPGIITVRQIDYMLDQRYQADVIGAQIEGGEAWWDKLSVGAALVGFACYERSADPFAVKLDKLYVHPRVQGCGYGYALVRNAEQRSRERGFNRLYLQVNKGNVKSIEFYHKAGFEVSDKVTVDIGNGFVMDDFIMSKQLEA